MPRTAVVIDSDYLKHDPGHLHPERPERLKVLLDLPKELDTKSFELLQPRAAAREEIETCHSGEYMGFCLFNTVAIGAHHLKRRYGAKRIMIMDWDVHHGNGTQDAFYRDRSVLYVSTHQYPFYPGTGAVREAGAGEGEGFTVNIPLPAGCGDAEYLRVFKEIVAPIGEKFRPDWILVSAGFDPHQRDPLGAMDVTEQGFGAMAAMLLRLAEKHCGGKIAFLLEGGYDLAALKNSVLAVLQQMKGPAAAQISVGSGGESVQSLIRNVLEFQEKYW